MASDIMLAAFDEIIERTVEAHEGDDRRPSRTARIRSADVMDDDGMGTRDIPIKVRIDVRGGKHPLRFRGHGARR